MSRQVTVHITFKYPIDPGFEYSVDDKYIDMHWKEWAAKMLDYEPGDTLLVHAFISDPEEEWENEGGLLRGEVPESS